MTISLAYCNRLNFVVARDGAKSATGSICLGRSAIYKLKRRAATTNPCIKPIFVRIHDVRWLPSPTFTWTQVFVYRASIAVRRSSGILQIHNFDHSLIMELS